jgi:hypothetical protein
MRVRRSILLIAMLVTLGSAVVSMWRLRGWITVANRTCTKLLTEPAAVGRIITEVIYVQRTMHQILLICSAIVVVGVLELGALRVAVLKNNPAANFPESAVLLFGTLFTVVLAFIFLPINAGLNEYKRKILDTLYVMPADGRLEEHWYAGRSRLQRLMRLPASAIESFRAWWAILGPVVGSIVVIFVPGLHV